MPFDSRSFWRFARALLYRTGPANPPVLQATRPLAKSSDIPFLNGFVNTTETNGVSTIETRTNHEHAQSDGKSMNRGLPVLD